MSANQGRDAGSGWDLPCCVQVFPGETVEEAEARHRREFAKSHESVLAALARILFGRQEEEQQREAPWSQPCVRYPEDDRGAAR